MTVADLLVIGAALLGAVAIALGARWYLHRCHLRRLDRYWKQRQRQQWR